MSSFILSMLSAGLIEMPPVSNVIPLPTSPRTGALDGLLRLVTQHDDTRRLGAAARHAEQQAHLQLGDALSRRGPRPRGRPSVAMCRRAVGEDARASACCPARSTASRARFVHSPSTRPRSSAALDGRGLASDAQLHGVEPDARRIRGLVRRAVEVGQDGALGQHLRRLLARRDRLVWRCTMAIRVRRRWRAASPPVVAARRSRSRMKSLRGPTSDERDSAGLPAAHGGERTARTPCPVNSPRWRGPRPPRRRTRRSRSGSSLRVSSSKTGRIRRSASMSRGGLVVSAIGGRLVNGLHQ